jgi:hypothetical protein
MSADRHLWELFAAVIFPLRYLLCVYMGLGFGVCLPPIPLGIPLVFAFVQSLFYFRGDLFDCHAIPFCALRK